MSTKKFLLFSIKKNKKKDLRKSAFRKAYCSPASNRANNSYKTGPRPLGSRSNISTKSIEGTTTEQEERKPKKKKNTEKRNREKASTKSNTGKLPECPPITDKAPWKQRRHLRGSSPT